MTILNHVLFGGASMPDSSPRRTLRELVNAYLRECEGWREHPEYARTYMQWEDLRATGEHDTRTLPTDVAAMRQMGYEAMDRD